MAETHISVAPEVDWLASAEHPVDFSWSAIKEGTAGPITLSPLAYTPFGALHAYTYYVFMRETLISFDLSSIPADATIISATLTLDVAAVRSSPNYVTRIIGVPDPTWQSGVVTASDWRKASYLATLPHSFSIGVSSLVVGRTVDIPFLDLTGLSGGTTFGMVLAEATQINNTEEPPFAILYQEDMGAAFYSGAAVGRTAPTLTVVHKNGTYEDPGEPGEPGVSRGTGGLIMGANF